MAKEIEYAVSEAFMLNLSTEQGIKFVMRVSNCSREVAKQAMLGGADISMICPYDPEHLGLDEE